MWRISEDTWKLIEGSANDVCGGNDLDLTAFLAEVATHEPNYVDRRKRASELTAEIGKNSRTLATLLRESVEPVKTGIQYTDEDAVTVIEPVLVQVFPEREKEDPINNKLLDFFQFYQSDPAASHSFYQRLEEMVERCRKAEDKVDAQQIKGEARQEKSKRYNRAFLDAIGKQGEIPEFYKRATAFLSAKEPGDTETDAILFRNYTQALYDLVVETMRQISDLAPEKLNDEQKYFGAANLLTRIANERERAFTLYQTRRAQRRELSEIDGEYPDVSKIQSSPGLNDVHYFVLAYHLAKSGKYKNMGEIMLDEIVQGSKSVFLVQEQFGGFKVSELHDFKIGSTVAKYLDEYLEKQPPKGKIPVDEVQPAMVPELTRRIDEHKEARVQGYIDGEMYGRGYGFPTKWMINPADFHDWVFNDDDDAPSKPNFRLSLDKPFPVTLLVVGNHVHGTFEVRDADLPTYKRQ